MKITHPFRGLSLLLILLAAVFSVTAQQKPKATPAPKSSPAVVEPAAASAPKATAIPMDLQSAMSTMRFRDIGPATMGGRIDDIEVAPNDPRTIYVATAAG